MCQCRPRHNQSSPASVWRLRSDPLRCEPEIRDTSASRSDQTEQVRLDRPCPAAPAPCDRGNVGRCGRPCGQRARANETTDPPHRRAGRHHPCAEGRRANEVVSDFLPLLFFPPDFPPNSSLQGGKWRHGTVSSQSKKPYFPGQNGTARYRTIWVATV